MNFYTWVAKSTCIHSWQTQGSNEHIYLCFLTISNSAFVFLARSRVCSKASAVSCRRTSTPSNLHTCIRNISDLFINSKYSQALYCRQQKAGMESELQRIQNQFQFLRVVQMHTHFSSAFMLGALILSSVDWSRVTWAFRS